MTKRGDKKTAAGGKHGGAHIMILVLGKHPGKKLTKKA